MNLKRIFGTSLTIIGVAGLVYGATLFVNTADGTLNIKSLATFGILGLLFFITGISLIRTIKDEA